MTRKQAFGAVAAMLMLAGCSKEKEKEEEPVALVQLAPMAREPIKRIIGRGCASRYRSIRDHAQDQCAGRKILCESRRSRSQGPAAGHLGESRPGGIRDGREGRL